MSADRYIDHYAESVAELERATKQPDDPGNVFTQPPAGPAVELGHVLLATVHALLALVDAIDDASTERNRP